MERDSIEPIHQTTGMAARTKASVEQKQPAPSRLDLRKELVERRHHSETQVRRPAVPIDRNAAT